MGASWAQFYFHYGEEGVYFRERRMQRHRCVSILSAQLPGSFRFCQAPSCCSLFPLRLAYATRSKKCQHGRQVRHASEAYPLQRPSVSLAATSDETNPAAAPTDHPQRHHDAATCDLYHYLQLQPS